MSESEIVRSSMSDSGPSSYHQLPGAALFGDSVQESEFPDEEMLDLSFLTGSTCFDIEPANAVSSAEGIEGSLWDTCSRLGFPPVFPYSKQSDSMSDLERYLRLPVAAPPPRMAVDPTSTVTSPWNNVTVRCDGVRYLLRKYAGGRSDGDEVDISDAETGRPLMEMLTRLERAARAPHEAKADVALGAWPDPTTVELTAATAKKLLPPRPQCDVLVRAYIKTFESLLRVLDVPSFLLQYDRFWEPPSAQPTSADQISICHILLVITLGSCVTISPLATADSQSALQQETAARISFARHWLTRQMVSGYRASLGVAQSMCLLALAGLIQPRPSSALTGADFLLGDYDLTRIGFQIGLHREPTTRNPGMSAKEVNMRRGLWATMLELSLQRCFEKGLPAPLMPESYDCGPPSGSTGDDEEAGETFHSADAGKDTAPASPDPGPPQRAQDP
ncbi:hypothetical protein CONLIGDRAFT_645846 [Coniochaeta ligniaria NRRL 30616]|uniref:Transcription factor domain-containing protein n=1 Tax=Coniochaeta ligniaria NRRL 30616 TaxID=1408157 RepID=A0A1J7IIS0_9PEZI|nr:hypothetical protein CONLIGDRAFT_645846 [Coniochaeta ligniaria NRRL 30616]